MFKEGNKVKKIMLSGLFTALIIIGAFIKIPIPLVPFTLQFLFTMLAGLLLGGRLGACSVLTYIILGLIGMPIFSGGGGLGYVIKPTFGYIIGFAIGTYVTGSIANKEHKPSFKRLLIANLVGLLIVNVMGVIYFYIVSNYIIASPIGVWAVILNCSLIFLPKDIFLCIIGALLAKRLIPILNKLNI